MILIVMSLMVTVTKSPLHNEKKCGEINGENISVLYGYIGAEPCGNELTCLNEGKCVGQGSSLKCSCPCNYTGDQCELKNCKLIAATFYLV